MNINSDDLLNLTESVRVSNENTINVPKIAHLEKGEILWFTIKDGYSFWVLPFDEVKEKIKELKTIIADASDEAKAITEEDVKEAKEELYRIYEEHIETSTVTFDNKIPLRTLADFGNTKVYFKIVDGKLLMFPSDRALKDFVIDMGSEKGNRK